MEAETSNLDELTRVLDQFSVHELPDEVLAKLVRETTMTSLEGSHHTTLLLGRPYCRKTLVWILGGRASTDSTGQSTIDLDNHLYGCHDKPSGSEWRVITSRPAFVATPCSDSPVLLTTKAEMEPVEDCEYPCAALEPVGSSITNSLQGYKAKVKVTSWNVDGKPASRILYSWTCIVVGERRVLLPG